MILHMSVSRVRCFFSMTLTKKQLWVTLLKSQILSPPFLYTNFTLGKIRDKF